VSASNKRDFDLAALLAHELEAPLLSLELELRSLVDAAPCRSAAERGLDQVRALREMSAALVELAREETETRRFPVEPILARLQRRFHTIAESRSVGLLRSETDVEATGDPRATEHVLQNLLHNAIKLSPPGGRVVVSATSGEAKVTVTVSDDGPGIDAETAERIFEPFFRLDRDAPGSGLGLAVARKLAELQGGRILVESEPGKGSRFTLELEAP
jgi:signal transduction histidine kinase